MELEIYGEIGREVKLTTIAEQLKKSRGDLTIKMNSYGGDVAEGQAIYNVIKEYSGHVTCVILGICASAATLIAMAADKIVMKENASFMIHEASVSLSEILQKDDLSKLVTALETINESIITIYNARTKLSKDELRAMLKDETWMSAASALERGFIDEVEKISQASEDIVATLKTKFVAEERARVSKLNSVTTSNPATRAILDVAVANGQTLEEIQPFLDAIGKTKAESKTKEMSVFEKMLADYYESGAKTVTGSANIPKSSIDNGVLKAMNEYKEAVR